MPSSTLQGIKAARRQLLETVQFAYGSMPQWPFIRSRLLRIFGDSGLEQESQDYGNVLEQIRVARKSTLDALQGAFGFTPQWENVRRKVMLLFGRQGLEGYAKAMSMKQDSIPVHSINRGDM